MVKEVLMCVFSPPLSISFSQLSFGGMPYSGKPVGGGRKNFKGCMESINYNGDNITDLARRKKLDTSSFVREIYTFTRNTMHKSKEFETPCI